ncbi:sensor histidine kinase [Oceanicola sp. S124]|uniref:sensor histidine kinase n=1 Tax=Oceanicola sp. S124 TaxID=1042378 RepID=UPI000255975B|nr:sensor histidine kinase [Oceanicola sp. S124]
MSSIPKTEGPKSGGPKSGGPPAGDAGLRPTLSLTARLVAGLGALLLVGGVVLALAAFAYGRTAAREAFDRLLVGAANDIASTVAIRDGQPVVDLPASAFQLLALAPEDRVAYRISGPGDQLLTGYEGLPAPPEGGDTRFYDAEFMGEPARYILVSRRFAERSFSGQVDVVVGQTLRARNDLARDITGKALVVLAIGGLAVLLLAVLIVRGALGPLGRLAARLEARDPQDLTPLDGRIPREVLPMVVGLNGFMGRLDRQFGTMRRLISDTAHQLRNPVAALRAQADLAGQESDPERQRLLVGRIHARTKSLGHLLDQMLSRAMVVHRGDSARRALLDLRDVALEAVEADDPQLLAGGAAVALVIGEDPVMVRGDALSLTEAAKNLLSNALRHGRAPVVVGVGVGAEDGLARLWVEDAGPGPAEEVRAQLGDRFVAGAAQGSGLGLSIAGAVAEAFGGRLEMSGGHPFRMALVLEVAQ